MNILDILPAMLRVRSLSTEEIVLSHMDAIRAIDALLDFEFAVTGWEAWVYRGRNDYEVSSDIQGEFGFQRKRGEDWEAFVRRTGQLTRTAIMDAQRKWMHIQTDADEELYFCLKAESRVPI